MKNFEIVSCTDASSGPFDLSIKSAKYPGIVFTFLNVTFEEDEELNVVVEVAVFRTISENGQLVNQQIVDEDPEFDSWMEKADEVFRDFIVEIIDENIEDDFITDFESKINR